MQRTIRNKRGCTIIAGLALLLGGCNGTPESRDITPPRIVSTMPAEGAENVPDRTVIEFVFDEPIASASVSPHTVFMDPDPGFTYTFPDSRTLRLVLLSGLPYQSPITAIVNPTITDFDGNSMHGAYYLHFFTARAEAPGRPIAAVSPQSWTNRNPWPISGSKANGSELVVNGVVHPEIGLFDSFSIDITLAEGPNEIRLQARFPSYDPDDNIISDPALISVVLDQTPPPPPVPDQVPATLTGQEKLSLSGTLDNGEVLSAEANGALISAQQSNGVWEVIFHLSEGANSLKLWRTDFAGNKSLPWQTTVVRDTTPPQISIANFVPITSATTVNFTVSANENVAIYVNGTLQGSGVALPIQPIPLVAGLNQIQIAVRDNVGNSSRAIVYCEQVATVPELLYRIPRAGSTITAPVERIVYAWNTPLATAPAATSVSSSAAGIANSSVLSRSGLVVAFSLPHASVGSVTTTASFIPRNRAGLAGSAPVDATFVVQSGTPLIHSPPTGITGTSQNGTGALWFINWDDMGGDFYEVELSSLTATGGSSWGLTGSTNLVLTGPAPLAPVSLIVTAWYADGGSASSTIGPLTATGTVQTLSDEPTPFVPAGLYRHTMVTADLAGSGSPWLLANVTYSDRLRFIPGWITDATHFAPATTAEVSGPSGFGSAFAVDDADIYIGASGAGTNNGCVYKVASGSLSVGDNPVMTVGSVFACGSGGERLGSSVVVDNDRVLVCAPNADAGGTIHGYDRSGNAVFSIHGWQGMAAVTLDAGIAGAVLVWSDLAGTVPQRTFQLLRTDSGGTLGDARSLPINGILEPLGILADMDGDTSTDVVLIVPGSEPRVEATAGGLFADLSRPEQTWALPATFTGKTLYLLGSGRIGLEGRTAVFIGFAGNNALRVFAVRGSDRMIFKAGSTLQIDELTVLGETANGIIASPDLSGDGLPDLFFRRGRSGPYILYK